MQSSENRSEWMKLNRLKCNMHKNQCNFPIKNHCCHSSKLNCSLFNRKDFFLLNVKRILKSFPPAIALPTRKYFSRCLQEYFLPQRSGLMTLKITEWIYNRHSMKHISDSMRFKLFRSCKSIIRLSSLKCVTSSSFLPWGAVKECEGKMNLNHQGMIKCIIRLSRKVFLFHRSTILKCCKSEQEA